MSATTPVSTPAVPIELKINPSALRVKKAKFASWFRGKRHFIWWAGILFDGVLAGLVWSQGLKIYQLLLAAALAKLIILVWYRWELKELRAVVPQEAESRLEQMIGGEILAGSIKAQDLTQLWLSLKGEWQTKFIVNRFGFDFSAIAGGLSSSQVEMQAVWQTARKLAIATKSESISAGILVVVLILSLPNSDDYLAKLHLEQEDLIEGLLWIKRLEKTFAARQNKPYFGGVGRDWAFGYTPLLNRFASNLSRQVEGGAWRLNLEIHEPLVEQIATILAQPTNNSVALVGESGVGKTTLAYALAEEILTGRSVGPLRYDQVLSLNASVLIANAGNRGELESLVMALLSEAIKARNIIIFLDDAQLFLSDETGSVNLSNILLPVLQNNRVRLMMAISPGFWQKLSASNPDLAAHINYQAISEPDQATTLAVLQDQAIIIESQTKSTITYQAIVEAYRLADRYSSEQANPGKSVKLLLAAANFSRSGVVTVDAVQQSVENTLGVKVTRATQLEKDKLLNLEAELHQHMINQDYGVGVVADALRRARAGVRSATRPVGSFLFLGPTGVGKTQLARALAEVYYGGAEKIIRVDMSEYSNATDVSRLLDTGSDTNVHSFLMQLRTNPFSVVLLDEIEKAHPQVLNLLLQMLDEGHVSDSGGRKVSFKEAIIIVTSNAGADEIRAQIEAGHSLEQFSAEFVDSLINRKAFLPELINRFDEVVLFRPLKSSELRMVVDLMIADVNRELARQKISVLLSDEAKDWLVQNGNDPRLGARPLRRTIQRTVENVVAKRLLDGSVGAGQQIELGPTELENALNN